MSVNRQPGLVLTEHTFSVPLDHGDPGGERIDVFARELSAADEAGASRPWLLYLQGGPGCGSPRTSGRETWLDRALRDFRVLLLDQRGTGRSTPVSRHTLACRAPPSSRRTTSRTSAPTRSSGTPSSSGRSSPGAARGACSARVSAGSAR